jgi:hypothetical protein
MTAQRGQCGAAVHQRVRQSLGVSDIRRDRHWPNQTVFVLESRRSETNAAPNVGGRFQGEMLGLEAEVKDTRFPDGWAFFNFGRAAALTPLPRRDGRRRHRVRRVSTRSTLLSSGRSCSSIRRCSK